MSSQSGLYKIEVYNSSGTLIAQIRDKVKNFRYSLGRNREEQIALSLDLRTIEDYARSIKTTVRSLFEVCRNSVRIKRGDNYICAGEIQYHQGAFDEQDGKVEVRAFGWLQLLDKRYTDDSVIVTSTDAGTVMRARITATESESAFGLTLGTNQTSTPISREYEYKNLKELLVQESSIKNGPDFEFTYDKIFNTYYPTMARHPVITFEYPGSIKSIAVAMDGTQLVNQIIARGQGLGTEQLLSTRNNTASQTTYKLRQAVRDYNDAKETSKLNELADEELRVFSLPLVIPQLTLQENLDARGGPVILRDYWIGDKFKVKVPNTDYFAEVADNVYTIDGIEVSVDEHDVESVGINQGSKGIASPQNLISAETLARIKSEQERRDFFRQLRNAKAKFSGFIKGGNGTSAERMAAFNRVKHLEAFGRGRGYLPALKAGKAISTRPGHGRTPPGRGPRPPAASRTPRTTI